MTGAAPPLLLRENAAAEAGGEEMEARALAALSKLDNEWANPAELGAAIRPIESWELHETKSPERETSTVREGNAVLSGAQAVRRGRRYASVRGYMRVYHLF